MEGLKRLSKQLGNSDLPEPQNFGDSNNTNKTVDSMAVEDGVADALETTTAVVGGEEEEKAATTTKDLRGENKAPRKKSRRGRKYSYMLKGKGARKKEELEKPKPKYFCQF